ncbi:MAG: LuxR family transcriptional regulator, partial [Erythrobacter sp.]|nr:LuxR family transcriptional regulator [Erythrobacter sp.]
VCEPAYVADTAAFIANLRGTETQALAEQTTTNFAQLFQKAGL